MKRQVVRRLNAQKPRGQPGIIKVKFGCFYQAFSEILMVRIDQKKDVTGFQYRKPGTDSVMGYAAVVSQTGKIDQLAYSSAHMRRNLRNVVRSFMFMSCRTSLSK